MSSITRTDSDVQFPRWRQLLHERGLSDATIDYFQIRPDHHGWKYPVCPQHGAIRWKAFDSEASPKYRWLPNMPDDTRFYDPAGELADHIATANGVLIICEGEVDVWTLYEAGIKNATCTLRGAGTIPSWFKEELKTLGVTTIRVYADHDSAGKRHARNIKGAL